MNLDFEDDWVKIALAFVFSRMKVCICQYFSDLAFHRPIQVRLTVEEIMHPELNRFDWWRHSH